MLANVTRGGIGDVSYRWEESEDGTQWHDAPGANTGSSYTTPAITLTRYYRRAAISAGCGTVYSTAAEVSAGTVTGTNGTYRIECYPNSTGCWMVDNSKEGTPTYTQYPGHSEGERGYYYTWAQAQASQSPNVCPNGFHLPDDAEWGKLQSYINNSTDATERAHWLSSSELAGYYNGNWHYWGSLGYWWSSSSTDRLFDTGTSGMGGSHASSGYYVITVRCLKSN